MDEVEGFTFNVTKVTTLNLTVLLSSCYTISLNQNIKYPIHNNNAQFRTSFHEIFNPTTDLFAIFQVYAGFMNEFFMKGLASMKNIIDSF